MAPHRRKVVIVGAGVAGLVAANHVLVRDPSADIVVVERSDRAGGLVETEHADGGFVVEHGAEAILLDDVDGDGMAGPLAELEPSLVSAAAQHRRTLIASRGRLVRAPELGKASARELVRLLSSSALSVRGRLRASLEPFMPRGESSPDETVEAFFARRFGREAFGQWVEPILSDVPGPASGHASVRSLLPLMQSLEHEHGSIVVGQLVGGHRKQSRRAHAKLVTLEGGMGMLPLALAGALGPRLRTSVSVMEIAHLAGGGYRVETEAHGAIDADAVILAVPAHAASRIVDTLDADLAGLLAEIDHRSVTSIALAFERRDVPHPMRGRGFVVPAGEGRWTTACHWSSAVFERRAPDDRVLLRSFLPHVDGDDEELVAAALHDLRDLMGIEAAPLLARVRRHAQALPEYEIGHWGLLTCIRALASDHAGLALAGNAFGGVRIPECLRSGREAADAVLGALA